MKKIFIIISLGLLFFTCKKKKVVNIVVTGTIYLDCHNVASNKTYYFVGAPYHNFTPISFKTDNNGMFSYEVEKYSKNGFIISSNTNFNNSFGSFITSGETENVGRFIEKLSNTRVLKLNTNRVLTNLDTIRYGFQYSNRFYFFTGPITSDRIIDYNLVSINPGKTSEVKTFWWSFNKPSVGSNDNQVDYTIHGCASVADTAYINLP